MSAKISISFFCLKIDPATAQYLRIYVSGTIEAPPLPLPPTTPSPGAGQEGRWPMQWTTVAGAGAGAGCHQGSLKAAGAPSSCCCCPLAICTFVPSQQSRAVAAAPHWRLLRPPPNASLALAKVLLLPTFTNTVILIKVTRIAQPCTYQVFCEDDKWQGCVIFGTCYEKQKNYRRYSGGTLRHKETKR